MSGHGGKREGAGRKSEGDPKGRATLTLDRDILEWLDSKGQRSAIVNAILRGVMESEKLQKP